MGVWLAKSPKVWAMKVGTNLTRRRYLHWMMQGLNCNIKRHCHHVTDWEQWQNFPVPGSYFCVPPNPNVHPNTWFSKAIRRNMAAPLVEHTIKWESALHMDEYYVVGVTPTPYPRYKCIISIVSKEEKTYLVSMVDISQWSCPNFAKMLSLAVGKRVHWVPCKHLYYLFRYLCKIDYATDKLIHAPTFSYNEVIRLLELAGVAKKM